MARPNARAWGGYWPAAEADRVTGKLDDAALLPEAWGRTLEEPWVVAGPPDD